MVWFRFGENHLQREAGLKDSRDNILRYMRYLGGGEHNEDRLTTFVDRSPAVLEHFADWGIAFRLVRGVTDHISAWRRGRSRRAHVEVELISGFDLGEWKDRIVIPEDVLLRHRQEQLSWGAMNRSRNGTNRSCASKGPRHARQGPGPCMPFRKGARLRARFRLLTGLNVERLADTTAGV